MLQSCTRLGVCTFGECKAEEVHSAHIYFFLTKRSICADNASQTEYPEQLYDSKAFRQEWDVAALEHWEWTSQCHKEIMRSKSTIFKHNHWILWEAKTHIYQNAYHQRSIVRQDKECSASEACIRNQIAMLLTCGWLAVYAEQCQEDKRRRWNFSCPCASVWCSASPPQILHKPKVNWLLQAGMLLVMHSIFLELPHFLHNCCWGQVHHSNQGTEPHWGGCTTFLPVSSSAYLHLHITICLNSSHSRGSPMSWRGSSS